jgi:hypothetical protein
MFSSLHIYKYLYIYKHIYIYFTHLSTTWRKQEHDYSLPVCTLGRYQQPSVMIMMIFIMIRIKDYTINTCKYNRHHIVWWWWWCFLRQITNLVGIKINLSSLHVKHRQPANKAYVKKNKHLWQCMYWHKIAVVKGG